MQKYIVEVIYEQVIEKREADATVPERTVRLSVVEFEFESEDGEEARKEAQAHMDSILSEGLSLSGGFVVKSVIPVAAIKCVGLIDHKALLEYYSDSGLDPDSRSPKNENQSSEETAESASASADAS